MSDKKLKKLFEFYNKRYFANRLMTPHEICFKSNLQVGRDKCAGAATIFPDNTTALHIDKKLIEFNRLTRMILLHEMAHISAGLESDEEHNFRWGAEIDRLYREGAYDDLL